MDVPGCDDGSLVAVVGWASFLVFRVYLVEVPACDDGSLVVFGLVFTVLLVAVISRLLLISFCPGILCSRTGCPSDPPFLNLEVLPSTQKSLLEPINYVSSSV